MLCINDTKISEHFQLKSNSKMELLEVMIYGTPLRKKEIRGTPDSEKPGVDKAREEV